MEMLKAMTMVFMCVFAAFLFAVQAAAKPVSLDAFFFEQIQDDKNVTGASKIYTIETSDLTNTTRSENVLQLSFLQHNLLPGDKVTFYDGNFTSILQEYTSSTETPTLSFFTTSPDAQVVFTANKSDVTTSRSFIFLYRTIPKDVDRECNQLFYGRWGSIDSSEYDRRSKHCRYTVTLPTLGGGTVSILFDNLTIPVGEKLTIWKVAGTKNYSRYFEPHGSPLKVFTHADSGRFHYIAPGVLRTLVLDFNSTTQFKIRFYKYSYQNVINEIGESGEISIPITPYPNDLSLIYRITVPRGYAKITVHDLYLPKYDRLDVARFNGKSWDFVRSFKNDSDLSTNTVVSDSSSIEVIYNKLSGNSACRYRITYSMIETTLKTCKTFQHMKKSQFTKFTELYEGWEESFTCADGFGNERVLNHDVTILCQANGEWKYGKKTEECRKLCPPLASLYNISSRGLFRTFGVTQEHLSGDNVTFTCKAIYTRLTYKTVTCTSTGAYSAPPPFCEELDKSNGSDLALVLSLSLSVPIVFVMMLGLGYIILRYTTFLSAEYHRKLFGPSNRQDQRQTVHLQENVALGNGAGLSNDNSSQKMGANEVGIC
ncbi:uncharacterized protein LOC114536692 [Dendronephthya gigantea]|uniref:uncharacterized protein LOC114536692 n=1 Tax=Dendronephthya gigantea TaxID=151771 RepID=UPI00106953F4|nr:uncharacterized protein LOC114536692 [Dendronephthya gigantea]